MESQICLRRERRINLPKFDQNVHIRISSRMMECLQQLSRDTGWSVAWIVRHATQKYLSVKGYLTK